MISLRRMREIAREVIEASRDDQQAAIIRRYLRARGKPVVLGRRTVVIGETLVAAGRVPWRRLSVLAVLVVLGVRR